MKTNFFHIKPEYSSFSTKPLLAFDIWSFNHKRRTKGEIVRDKGFYIEFHLLRHRFGVCFEKRGMKE